MLSLKYIYILWNFEPTSKKCGRFQLDSFFLCLLLQNFLLGEPNSTILFYLKAGVIRVVLFPILDVGFLLKILYYLVRYMK